MAKAKAPTAPVEEITPDVAQNESSETVVETPETSETPEDNAPETETSETGTPEATEVSETETPKVETKEVETPKVETPKASSKETTPKKETTSKKAVEITEAPPKVQMVKIVALRDIDCTIAGQAYKVAKDKSLMVPLHVAHILSNAKAAYRN